MEVDQEEREHKEVEIPHYPPSGETVEGSPELLVHQQVEKIYQAYPRRVGKPAAVRAIRRALLAYQFDFILERTQLFANTYSGDPQFIPNPTTFFNQQRFADEPATWHRGSASGNRTLPAPAIITRNAFGTGSTKI